MGQITAALIGISVTLVSVFLPMAFFSGSVGNIYRQFSLVMVSAMLCSVFLALSLTPALCATFLKPVEAGHKMEKGGVFGLVQPRLQGDHARLRGTGSRRSCAWTGRFLVIFALIVGVVVLVSFTRMPSSFLPTEDQGYLIANVQLPPGATQARTLAVMQKAEEGLLPEPARSRQDGERARPSQLLRQWPELRRSPSFHAQAVGGAQGRGAFGADRDRRARLRRARRHSRRLADLRSSCRRPSPSSAPRPASRSASRTVAATATARWSRRATNCSAWRRRARFSPGVRPDGLEDAPQLFIDIDRDRASALGVSFDNINQVLSTALGSAYVNDFPNAGRLQRVIVQADAPDRMQPDDLMQLNVVNNQGKPVPMAALASTRWITGPIQTIRYNGYPSMRISGDAAPGFSTGDAMDEMERLAGQLPAGFAFEWTKPVAARSACRARPP